MLFIQNYFCKYFLPVSGFSYFPDSTFCRTEVLHFNKVKYQLFLFINHTFDVVSKKSLSYPKSSRFFSFLLSRSFIVLHFTFKSMIHFELIFVKCVKLCLDFFFFRFPPPSSRGGILSLPVRERIPGIPSHLKRTRSPQERRKEL